MLVSKRLTTEYRYNGFGEKVAQISPDTGTTRYRYDDAGNLTAKVDARGVETHYVYDLLGRATHVQYPASPEENIAYHYDAMPGWDTEAANDSRVTAEEKTGSGNWIGRLAYVKDASGFTAYSYNHRGQITEQNYRIGNADYRMAYHYSPVGQLKRADYPSGRQLKQEYTDLGQLAKVTTVMDGETQTIASGFEKMPFGSLASFTYGNNSHMNIKRDLMYRISDIQVTGESANDVLFDVGYRYDEVSNITDILNHQRAEQSQRFDYDASYRLAGATGDYGHIQYDYDGVGNRLRRDVNGSTEFYEYEQNSNRLLEVSSAGTSGNIQQRQLNYDAVGNIVFDTKDGGERDLHYSANNRLASVELDNTSGALYTYNAKGQRVSKTVKGITTHFHYDIADRLVAETQISKGENQPLREFMYGMGQRLAIVDHTQETEQNTQEKNLYFVVNDHLGTPQLLVDAHQTIVWSNSASPFGEMALADSGVTQPLRFPGQYADEETGYSYNYFRDYDPSLGRYIQSDPIGLAGGVNTFGYVGGMPVIYTDLYGLDRRVETTDSPVFGHQRISVDMWALNPKWSIPMSGDLQYIADGTVAYSFGLKEGESKFGGMGEIYHDAGKTASIVETRKTTPAEDIKFITGMQKKVGDKPGYNIVTNNCRTFSQGNL